MENQNLTMEQAQGIMERRNLIVKPGKYEVRVVNDPQVLADSGKIRKPLQGGSTQISIANFNAVTPWHLERYRQHMEVGEFDEAVSKTLTASIRDIDFMPRKNETVEIQVSKVKTKDGLALLVTGVYEIPTQPTMSVADFLAQQKTQHIEETEQPLGNKAVKQSVPQPSSTLPF